MKVQLESTDQIVYLNGVPARIWEGVTDSGIKVHAYVTRIAISEDEPAEIHRQFEEELKACRKPTVEGIPLRLII